MLYTETFASPLSICLFVNDPAQSVTSIVSIVCDSSGEWHLFYKKD